MTLPAGVFAGNPPLSIPISPSFVFVTALTVPASSLGNAAGSMNPNGALALSGTAFFRSPGAPGGIGGQVPLTPVGGGGSLQGTFGGIVLNLFSGQYEVDATGTPFDPGQTYSYQVAQADGQTMEFVNVTNQSLFTAVGFDDPFLFSLTGDSSGAVFLNITPIPEPATVLGLAAGALSLGGLIRRRKLRRA